VTSLVVVSAGLSDPSSTRLLADRIATVTARSAGDLDVVHVELRDLAHQLTDRLLTGFAAERLAAAQDAVAAADGVVAVTPVLSASYSGLFKTFFDVLDEGALEGVPVLIAATAGTPRHSLVLEHALRPLFSHLRAVVVPTAVFAATADFASADLEARVGRAAGELAALLGATDATPARRRTADDALDDVTPFEELLRQAGQ